MGSRTARYALRLSIAATIAVALARIAHIEQGQWLVLTTLFVVQPTFSQTVKVSSLRVFGTLPGAIVALILALALQEPLLMTLTILPLAIETFATRTFSHVSYILYLTPHFSLVALLGASATVSRRLC